MADDHRTRLVNNLFALRPSWLRTNEGNLMKPKLQVFILLLSLTVRVIFISIG